MTFAPSIPWSRTFQHEGRRGTVTLNDGSYSIELWDSATGESHYLCSRSQKRAVGAAGDFVWGRA